MASCSTSFIQKRFKYHVFLSFRGEDVRKNFVDHFYEALEGGGIYTYKDDEKMEKGERIDDELLKAIEESKFFIIVFSKNYASSSWCLNELVKIMECRKTTHHQTAYPVFYHVDPTHVRKQSGPFGEAFAVHNKEETGKWRDTLEEAGNLAGWVLKNTVDGHEAKFIKKIVQQISFKLRSVNEYINKKIVGMEARVEKVLSSLETSIDDFRMTGIKGIGGCGKTTLARAVFDQIYTQFEGKSFVENVRQVSQRDGLQALQAQVLSDVLNDQSITVSSVRNGKSRMKNVLRGRKVLIVLDDVDHIDQLEAVAESDWFEPGSRVIITTKDKHVMIAHGVKQIHDVDLLSDEEALCLFSRYAFGTDIPTQGYEKLSREFVCYADGLPLMIKILGRLLCGRDDQRVWADQLESLKTKPLREPMEILKLSYNGLESSHKDIFLDVACFLKSRQKDDVIKVLESCGFNARSGLDTLEEKSLVSISDDNYVEMHNLIQEMGRYSVRHLHPDDPERHSRLWILQEIEYILANHDLGPVEARAIAVDNAKLDSQIVIKGFGNMKKLRFLRVVSETEDDETDRVVQNLPYGLKYLSWRSYPHWSLPNTFEANNLVALELPECRIVQLWGSGQQRKVLKMLRFLILSFSKLRTLDLKLTPNLEMLDLNGCSDLEELHTPDDDDGCLKRLGFLNLKDCVKIRHRSLSFIRRLESLKVLCLTGLSMEEFPFPNITPEHYNYSLLEKLQFGDNRIEELPPSIGHLQKLVNLDLRHCKKLRSLPGSICGLRNLRNLKLYGCILEELPEKIGRLACLEKLDLSHTSIKHLPDSICEMRNLKTLKLSFCRDLERLPGDLGKLECLEKLVLRECTQVKDIPDSICRLMFLKYLSLLGCIQLEKLPKELGGSGCLTELNVKGTSIRKLPPSISSLQGLKIIQDRDDSFLRSPEYASGELKSSSTGKRRIDN